MNEFNFTKSEINKLPRPKKGMKTYKDIKEKGLSLYITATGAVTFFVRKRVNGRDERIKIGTFPETTVENARIKALKTKAAIADGKNPNHEKRKIRSEITFGELFNDYMNRYSKKQKRSWKYDEREVNKFLSHWFHRKISSITKFEIIDLHEKIGDENGHYQANRLLERVRAIFNKAIEWGWDGNNPAQGIKKFKEVSRDRFIQPNELPCLFYGLEEEENETAQDYILISLLTGARKSNVLAMRWENIDLTRCEWKIPRSKNDDPVHIPLTSRAVEILQNRRRKTNSEWVFPSPSSSSKTGHYSDPKKAWKRVLKRATIHLWKQNDNILPMIEELQPKHQNADRLYDAIKAEAQKKGTQLPIGLMDIRLHDIRRTLGSYQAITGSSLPIIGKSLGHKSQQATQIYSRLNLDPVRDSLERASDTIFLSQKK